MRIALVSDLVTADGVLSDVPSGESVRVAGVAQALAGRGHGVTVYVPRGEQDRPDQLEASGSYAPNWVEVGPAAHLQERDLLPLVPSFRHALGTHWAKNTPDIAHARSWMGVDVPQRRRLERALVHTVDRIVASSTSEVFELRQLGLRRGQARIVPSGVDTDRFRPDGPVAKRGGIRRLLTVGGLERHQGVDDIVQVLPALPGVGLVVAGGQTADRTGQVRMPPGSDAPPRA